MTEETYTEKDILSLQSNFSIEDQLLSDWLKNCHSDLVLILVERLQKQITNDAITDWYLQVNEESLKGTIKSKVIRNYLSIILVHELKEYSGNTFNIFSSKPDYAQILTNVHKKLGKRFKQNVPEIDSVKNRENAISEILLKEALNTLSSDELYGAIKGTNLKATKETAKKIFQETIATGGIAYLANLLGKKTLKKVMIQVLEKAVIKHLGKKAATEIIGKVAKKVAQKTFKNLLGYVGWALLAKDIFDIAGEASRVTLPFVTSISIYRCIDRQIINSKAA